MVERKEAKKELIKITKVFIDQDCPLTGEKRDCLKCNAFDHGKVMTVGTPGIAGHRLRGPYCRYR